MKHRPTGASSLGLKKIKRYTLQGKYSSVSCQQTMALREYL